MLERTLGVPLFQEQAMQIAITAAGFSPAEADQPAARHGDLQAHRHDRQFRRTIHRGHGRARIIRAHFAQQCFNQIKGFGEYGFPESHAASFALLVYASSWVKAYYPDVFCAAMLNSQPMGFYAPAQLVRDAREHGVEIRPVDINRFELGLPAGGSRVRAEAQSISGMPACGISSRQSEPCGWASGRSRACPEDEHGEACRQSRRGLWPRSAISGCAPACRNQRSERLADADAFRSIGLSRREALWAVRALDAEERRRRAAAVRPGEPHATCRSSRMTSCRKAGRANRSSRTTATCRFR